MSRQRQERRWFGLPGTAAGARREGGAVRKRARRRLAIGGPYPERLEVRVLPANILVVNSTDDTTAAGTLRWAIGQANTLGGDQTIRFDPGVFATPQTISLASALPDLADTTGTVTINGPGNTTITRSQAAGMPQFRLFTVDSGVTAIVSGLTFAHGDDGANNDGGVTNFGNLTLDHVIVRDNLGSGVLNFGTMVLTNSTVLNNHAGQPGNPNQQTQGFGGGVWNNGTLSLTNDTIDGNTATFSGAGLYNFTAGTAKLTFVTIAGNTAQSDGNGIGSGGGIRNFGTLTLTDSIVAGNTHGTGTGTPDDISGAVDLSSANNLVGVGTNLTGISNGVNHNQIGTAASPIDPKLAPLADYGGLTPTRALLAGSPALGAGTAIAGITTDQRGFARGASIDIGAFQTVGPFGQLTVNSPSDTSGPGLLTLRQAINLANAVGDATVTATATDSDGNTSEFSDPVGGVVTATGSTIAATATAPFSGVVATFAVADPSAIATNFTAAIAWGDGTMSPGTVRPGPGGFVVAGTHTYAQPGAALPLAVTITDTRGLGSASASGLANVAPGPITVFSKMVQYSEGTPLAGVVATFVATDPRAFAGQFTATINWGDTSTSSGVITANGAGFDVSATHRYDRAGTYPIVVTINDAVTGASVSTTSTAQLSLALLNLTGVNFAVTGHKNFKGVVATFTDADPRIDPSFYTATITWDDGTTSTGSITGSNPFTVSATHTFGSFTSTHLITVTVTDKLGRTASVVDRVDDPDALTPPSSPGTNGGPTNTPSSTTVAPLPNSDGMGTGPGGPATSPRTRAKHHGKGTRIGVPHPGSVRYDKSAHRPRPTALSADPPSLSYDPFAATRFRRHRG